MPTSRSYAVFGMLLVVLLLPPALQAASICGPDGVQTGGSIYRICMPDAADYNGSLVIWAHGFQDAGTPVQIPEDQLLIGGISLPETINNMGFGFATNSYNKTGLAIRQGMADILDLVDVYTSEQGPPQRIYLSGVSEGAIITTLLVEQHPQIFSAGLASCGPIGDFPYQINYFGNARVVFEFFFPGLIPGDPFSPTQDLIDNWSTYYEQTVRPVVFDPVNRNKLDQWVRVTKLPFDSGDYLNTVEQSVRDVLHYAVVNFSDAATTLGGFPFDNNPRWYTGSDNDLLLNLLVPRMDADPAAITEMQTYYNTNGQLSVPLISLHTQQDQLVPAFHQSIYSIKTLFTGSFLSQYFPIPVDRYGHCNFEVFEVVVGFALMLGHSGWTNPAP